jgi:hypothetical protein
MQDCEIVRQVAEWNPKGKRRRGRPVNIWKGGIGESMQRGNLKDVSIESSEGKKLYLWAEENCVPTEKFIYSLHI